MLVALFTGNHDKDTLAVRIGWAMTRYTQRGPFGHITHCEAIHEELPDGTVRTASSSLRDGGVRAKTMRINPAHWLVVDCPGWDVDKSKELLIKTDGAKYDLRGALATRLPGGHSKDRWFCNQWVAHPFLQAADTFGPHHFAAVTLCVGRDVTAEFFKARA